ncbi:hypothetical protein [Streptomyces sp. NPDC001889]
MATDRDVARLRQKYTGEPRASAVEWYRSHGLHQGLVPDAADWAQEYLEAGILRALIRPRLGPETAASPGTLFGVAAVSPGVSGLTLWCKSDDLPLLLGRLLPAQTGGLLSGVPWLRPWVRVDEDLALGLIGRSTRITVRVRHSEGEGRTARARAERAGQEDLDAAAVWAAAAGGRPLWHDPVPHELEGPSFEQSMRDLADGESALWSRALRRSGLFLEQLPDWSTRPPAAEELEGPGPDRIRPRAAGAARTSGGGVVSVASVSGRGGEGCTTTALVLAAALARSGNQVLVLGTGDRASVMEMFGGAAKPGFADRGTMDVGALPPDPQEAREMIARARQGDYDVVVLDPGFQQHQLVGEGDLILAVIPEQVMGRRSLWTETRITDRRPEHVRMWQWLENRFAAHPSPPREPAERLLTFLDSMFDVYVSARTEDGDTSVYDVSDPEAAAEWWGDFDLVLGSPLYDDWDDGEEGDGEKADTVPAAPDSGGIDSWRSDFIRSLESHGVEEDDGEKAVTVPAGPDSGEIDSWRSDFIRFLDPHGVKEHPEHWARAAAGWAERHRQRQLAGLAPGERSEAEWLQELQEYLSAIEPQAVETWGRPVWEEHKAQWAAAFARDEDLLEPFRDLVERVEIPRPGADIARDLTLDMRGLPPASMPVLGVLVRARRDIDAGTLSDTASAITGHGLTGLEVLPHLTEWAGLWHDPALLSAPSPRASAAAFALARTVTGQLARSRDGGSA